MRKRFPHICLLLVVLICIYYGQRNLRMETDARGFNLGAYASLPVQADGRIKPMDSVARNSLRLIHGKTSLSDAEGNRIPAILWLMNTQMRPQIADDYPLFRIDHDQVLGLFGWQKGQEKYFSYNALRPFEQQLFHTAETIREKDRSQRDTFEQQLLNLANALMRYRGLSSFAMPAVIPPADGEPADDWHTLLEIISDEELSANWSSRTPVLFYRKLIEAYHGGEAEAFNVTASALHKHLMEREDTQKTQAEFILNKLDPFLQSQIIYLIAFLLACLSWLNWSTPLSKSALILTVFSFLIHTAGLITRMYLQGRPPVTNLYSSAIFVGWAAVLLGIVLEHFHKNGIGAATASLCGFASLLIAPALVTSTDTMEMMQAVLDSNFWLATHVVVISLGYSAMFVAGFLAAIYILLGVLSTGLDRKIALSLQRMVYAIICFALLFSFVGTMLGGVWADQSWGRFWGWDPKENGALLIVLWCAIILHARWGSLCGARGLMIMALAGNIITSWSWFGTNMLGVGLHSYGFADKQFMSLMAFIFSQLFIMGLGAFPLSQWRSFAKPSPTVSKSS